MKKLTVILIILFVVIIKSIAQYSNSTLNGAWFLYQTPLSPYSDSLAYIIFDGNGIVTDFSGFGSFTGSNYSVTTSGAITGSVISVGDETIPFTGQLTSQNAATLSANETSYVLTRISNPGAMAGSITGLLSTGDCGQRYVTINVNNQGIVTSSTGLSTPVSGRIYADLGVFMGHLKTGENNEWNELSIMGYYSGNSLNGKVGLDSRSCGNSLAQLIKSNNSSNTQSAFFDGYGDRIRVLDASPVNSSAVPAAYQVTGKAITVEAWIYPMKLPGKSDGGILVCRPYGNGEPWRSFELRVDNFWSDNDDPRIQWIISDGTVPGNWGATLDPNKPVVGSWTHVAGTYDGSKLCLYVNGNLVDQSNYSSDIGAGEIGLYIGGYTSQYFNGLIDEVRLWNVVRSQAQIQASMNQILTGSETGLVGYWPLDADYTSDGGLKAVADKTANHNDLQVQYDAKLVAFPQGVQPQFSITTLRNSDWLAVSGVKFSSEIYTNGWPKPALSLLTKPTGMTLTGDSLFWTPQAYQWKWNEVVLQASNNNSSRSHKFYAYVDQLATAQNQLKLDVSCIGKLGALGKYEKGMYYKSLNGLYAADFSLVDRNTSKFAGCMYNYGDSAFLPLDGFTAVGSRFPGFTAFKNTLVDAREKNRIGVQVNQTIHSSTAANDDKYVIIEYQVTNQSGATLPDMFAQLTADFDVGESLINQGGYDPALKLTYMYEFGGTTNPYYYGFTLLNNPVSGASIFKNGTDTSYIRSLDKLTVIEEDPTTFDDYRNQLNIGPFQLADGASRTFAFAFIAGDELNDIKYSAARANTVYGSYTALKGIEYDDNNGLSLSENYPNPFNNETRISYTVTNPGIVSLKVIDLQGKEVAVVFDKFVSPGTYSAVIEANNIPSGMYIYKLESNGFVVAKKLVVR